MVISYVTELNTPLSLPYSSAQGQKSWLQSPPTQSYLRPATVSKKKALSVQKKQTLILVLLYLQPGHAETFTETKQAKTAGGGGERCLGEFRLGSCVLAGEET